jgi:membrane fusion protein, multidrug efflux system
MPAYRTFALAFAAALSLAACKGHDAAPPAPPPPEVGTVTLTPQDVALSTELPGRTSAHLISEVRPQVNGIIQQRPFEEGTQVKAGDVLYQIDPAPYRAVLARAEAAAGSAKLLSDRYEQLIKTEAISQQAYDDAKSHYQQAKAAVQAARIDVGYTRITAPISGRIGRSAVTQGALVTAGQPSPLATIQQLDPIYVDITQPSTSVLSLKQDLAEGRLKQTGDNQAEVTLRLENGQHYAHKGALKFSEVNVDEGTGAVTLRAVFPNPDHLLMPGMFVRAQLQEGVRGQSLLVPHRGLTRDTAGEAMVMVVDGESRAQVRKVVAQRSIGHDWLVTDGLKAGDKVIVDGLQQVRPGVAVSAVQAQPAAAPSATASR